MTLCKRCEKNPGYGEIPAPVRVAATFSAAFLHMGVFAGEALKGAFCRGCRRVVVLQCLAGIAATAAGVMAGAALIYQIGFS